MGTRQTSPVGRIPTELLREIFLYCLPPNTYVTASKHTTPLLVSQVCVPWRRVALSVQGLWSSLKVIVSPQGSRPHISLIKLWLDRSRTYSLSLCLELDVFPPVSAGLIAITAPILHIFGAKSGRWQSLRLVLPGLHSLLKDIFKHEAPQLECLDLDLRGWQDGSEEIDLLFRSVPSLRRLSWGNRRSWGSWDMPFEDILHSLWMPWCQLTRIVLDSSINLQELRGILRQCLRIVECDVRHFTGASPLDDVQQSEPIFLPHLVSFTLYQLELDDGLGLMLDLLWCPVLQHIHVACGHIFTVQWPQPQFKSFLSRSSCPLETLSLEFTGISEESLIQCLQMSTTSLMKLEVIDAKGEICVTDRLLTMLTYRELSVGQCELLCQRLAILILRRVVASTDGVFASMVASRRLSFPHSQSPRSTPCALLEHVDFVVSDNSRHELDIRNLLTLRCDGLDIHGI